MDYNDIVKSYKKRLVTEAFLKSLLFAVIFGSAATGTYYLVDWFFGLKLVYVGAIVFAAVALIAGTVAFLRLKPSDKQIAVRMDALGLKERMITMLELKDDNSFIAELQRKETLGEIQSFKAGLIRFAVSLSLIITAAATGVFGAAATVVSAVSTVSGAELLAEVTAPADEIFTITYETDGNGRITGEATQLIKSGENGTSVSAEPEEGWMFVGWSDGQNEPTRQEIAVSGTHTFVAMFITADEFDEEDDEVYNGMSLSVRDMPQEKRRGDPNDDPLPSDGSEPGDQSLGGDGDGSGGSRARNDSRNMVIDGNTYYGDGYDNAVNDASGEINSGDDFSNTQKSVADGYFSNLNP